MSDKTTTTTHPLLAATARWTAGARAKESTRAYHLFSDPWAEALAGPEGAEWVAQRPAASLVAISLPTRYFDDFLQHITFQQRIGQAVLAAAGLDTRAFRLRWPNQTHVFERDQPQVLQAKAETLQALGVDLSEPWTEVLLEGGFDPRASSGWLLEGFLIYLSPRQLQRCLDEVTGLDAPGSWLCFDVINRQVLTSPWTRPWVEM